MLDRFSRCIIESFQLVPASVYAMLGILFSLGIILFWAFMGIKRGSRWVAGLLLLEYLFWIYSMTFFYRDAQVRSFNLTPFWSYQAIYGGDGLLLAQVIMNVVAFVPVGLLMGCFIGRMKWWQVLFAGVTLSLSIELLQFVSTRGFAEFDDIFHNLIGCMCGYGIYVGISEAMIRKKERGGN